jgi:CheY-like chemotaxis protein
VAKKVLWSEPVRSRIEGGGPHFLARASLKALSAGNSSAFFDAAASDRPDLVVLAPAGFDMPSLEMCRRLREDRRTSGIPILALAAGLEEAEALRLLGCTQVVEDTVAPAVLQEKIASMLGLRLRRYPRYPVVLPVARGRIFHEFLGYSNSVSEGGMGFETLARIRENEQIPLRIYRNTEEKPITVLGRVAGVRANIDTGIGYAVGIEFLKLAQPDRDRLMELFPDPSVTWGSDLPPDAPNVARRVLRPEE